MTSKIKLLDSKLINQIAAGEVIECPSNVVKELVENSIDAQSTQISIYIEELGLKKIRINDNGIGMSKEDLFLAIRRHSTSKINKFNDLFCLQTFGFRGEALSSIASISKMRIETANAQESILADIEEGKVKSVEKTARNQGTTINIEALFYNVPVRKKFQNKKNISDILKTINNIALCHPEISFSFVNDNRQVFKYKRVESIKERIKDVLGKEFFKEMIPFTHKARDIKIEGFLSKPELAKKRRFLQHIFINKRHVKYPFISDMIKIAYSTRISDHLFPYFILFFSINPSSIDVNIHPQKKQVKISFEELLKNEIIQAVNNSFSYRSYNNESFCNSHIDIDAVNLNKIEYNLSHDEHKQELKDAQQEFDFVQQKKEIAFCPLFLLSPFFIIDSVDILNKINEKHGLVVIDLTLACQKYIFESIMNKKKISQIQRLAIPSIVDLNHIGHVDEKSILFLGKIGFEIRMLSKDSICIDGIPHILKRAEALNIVIDIFEKNISMENVENIFVKKIVKSVILKTMNNTSFTMEIAILLTKNLFKYKDPIYSPSGKIIITNINQERLKTFFK